MFILFSIAIFLMLIIVNEIGIFGQNMQLRLYLGKILLKTRRIAKNSCILLCMVDHNAINVSKSNDFSSSGKKEQ